MRLYRFSPMENRAELESAVSYVATKTVELCEKVTGRKCPVSSLTVFAHYPEEYQLLQEILATLGDSKEFNNGPRITLSAPLSIGPDLIRELRIRQPDPYRSQVGCGDIDAYYVDFKASFLSACAANMRLISRPDFEMLELYHPDYDVLAYVVSP